ncbi:nucleopolyhedrovirus P10 family protein [Streptomyces sp. TRM66268-LWL]|uniref:Nucleopolyhedrovirus P10 family protein n=1 Tax=Streptomyces polyasparticus TaxID=2767826 RepID=A0ABR7S9N9_9ACTN|nr:nucleopolyhedrovirus P10 family protein [Streptomyces polyasparticus]MBC9711844.1 nucleopolyhedrovirus P10 family protein [Streptomyces polyasparticus]
MDPLAQVIRQQLHLGRLLPLGGPADGAWIAESAARAVLEGATAAIRGARVDSVRLALADPDTAAEPVVPGPPSALPPAPLRVTAECAAATDEPLPAVVGRLRSVLAIAAHGLGLVVEAVDLRITDLVAPGELTARTPAPGRRVPTVRTDRGPAARAALAVPGVTRLTGTQAGTGRAVQMQERRSPGALATRHLRIELATAAHHNALEVALAVRRAASAALPDRPTVAVLVTEVDGLA